MKKIKNITLGLFLAIGFASQGQDSTSAVQDKNLPFQMSFIYPMGTNGYDSKDITVNYSVNIIGGVVGGIHGFEMAGMFNNVNGSVKGVQAAGFSNFVREETEGAQFAGFSNVTLGDVKGVQAAGFSNVAKRSVLGTQLSGFANVATDTIKGFQAAGFANYANKSELTTTQLAGFANVILDSITGLQGAGFGNVTLGSVNGAQLSGFVNYAHGDVKGTQLAGFANVTLGEITGIQASGFINIARKVKGTQIGFINIADSVEGASIGFISIIRNGYNHIEIGGNESFYTNVNLKIGTEKFYNILSIGATPKKNNLNWGFGYGVGTLVNISDKLKFNLDASAYHVNENEWFTEKLNLLMKLSPTLTYKINDHFALYGGPTLNALIQNENFTADKILPWNGYQWDDNNTKVNIYPGFNAGVRF